MKIAVIQTDGDVPTLVIGNDDDFLDKLRGWYLETAYDFMQDKWDAEHTPDPATASVDDIAEWWTTDDGGANTIYIVEATSTSRYISPLSGQDRALADFHRLKASLIESHLEEGE
jgi:hypothetical protein